jgi:hypothetical protein
VGQGGVIGPVVAETGFAICPLPHDLGSGRILSTSGSGPSSPAGVSLTVGTHHLWTFS